MWLSDPTRYVMAQQKCLSLSKNSVKSLDVIICHYKLFYGPNCDYLTEQIWLRQSDSTNKLQPN